MTELPTTMRAAHLTARGGPEVLVVRDGISPLALTTDP